MENKTREKSPIRHKFNWLDALIIILALCLIVFTVLKLFPDAKDVALVENKQVKIEYTVQIDKLDNGIDLQLVSGDPVINIESKSNIGSLSANSMTYQYQDYVYNEQSGGIEIVNSDNYMTGYLTIVADALDTEYGYYVNGTRIAVESKLNLRISGLEAVGKCISVEVVSEQ